MPSHCNDVLYSILHESISDNAHCGRRISPANVCTLCFDVQKTKDHSSSVMGVKSP